MAKIRVSMADAGKVCPYCRFPLKTETAAEACDACGAIHHEECWLDGRGCAVFGCVNGGILSAAAPEQGASAGLAPLGPVKQRAELAVHEGPASVQSSAPTGSGGGRLMLLGIAVGLLAAAVAAGAFLLGRGGHGSPAAAPLAPTQPAASTVTVVTTTASTPAGPTAAQRKAAAERAAVRRLVAIVDYSQSGRTFVRSGLYDQAIQNRQTTLDRLASLTGGGPSLQRAKATFERAIRASLQSDETYASGGDATASDAQATRMKRLFVAQFDPIARRYQLPAFSADEI